MRFFDLHCDTIYRVLKEGGDIYKNNFHVSLSGLSKIDHYIGCFAICVTEECGEHQGFKLFNQAAEKIKNQVLLYNDKINFCRSSEDIGKLYSSGKNGLIFTVEGGTEISDDIDRITYLFNKGVRVLTLTWNGSNKIGDGAGISDSRGLTRFGREVIKKMESIGMIVDVSHASDPLFYDVSNVAQRPFIATHSNSRTVCNHKRNLTDEQFNIIKFFGGIVGINLHKLFLNDKKEADFNDILKHIDYFLSLGGENVICIGSDFDGADMPEQITGIESIPDFYEYCLKHNYNEDLLDKIFYRNAYDFFRKIL